MKPFIVLLAILLLTLFFYLIGAFIKSDFNFTHWSETFRVTLLLCYLPGATFYYLLRLIN